MKCCAQCLWYIHVVGSYGQSMVPNVSHCKMLGRKKQGGDGKSCKHFLEYTTERAQNLNLV